MASKEAEVLKLMSTALSGLIEFALAAQKANALLTKVHDEGREITQEERDAIDLEQAAARAKALAALESK